MEAGNLSTANTRPIPCPERPLERGTVVFSNLYKIGRSARFLIGPT